MIHLYCGEGKGKTTAAMGLAVRRAGRGRGVVIAQFLKGADSGERRILAQLPQVTVLEVPEQLQFLFQMTPEEREEEKRRSLGVLNQAAELARREGCGLLVLDEAVGAAAAGVLPLAALLDVIDHVPVEVVLTGRDPAPELLARADDVTEMVKLRHPFDQGQRARPGVEY